MKCASIAFLVLGSFASAPEPAIPYFTNVREVQVSQTDRQNYLVVDEEIWTHARPDLADLRIYNGQAQVQYALSERYGGFQPSSRKQKSSTWEASPATPSSTSIQERSPNTTA